MNNTLMPCNHKIKIDYYSQGRLFVSCSKCDFQSWCFVDQFDGVNLLLPILQPLLRPISIEPTRYGFMPININQQLMGNSIINLVP